MSLLRLFKQKEKPRATARGGARIDLGETYRAILVPIDMRHADASTKAMAVAAECARLFGAELHMLTVRDPLGGDIADLPLAHRSEFETYAARQAKLLDIAITPVFRVHESPQRIIAEVAEEFGIDLIVMASHDPKIADHLFGSNASEVALHAPCSVFVVR